MLFARSPRPSSCIREVGGECKSATDVTVVGRGRRSVLTVAGVKTSAVSESVDEERSVSVGKLEDASCSVSAVS
ncbi:hypothetical protein F2Q70_00008511 [Brassica cretica]|uniref:Uncharacterized protein n=2 Tax=Brassica cretica TaxID=69181 RepID=A0A3N6RZF9_BRACR|nr:hypothetical protein F2Q68_00001556 [Brassica cretica]KAF2616290.1 hypothetical protein F2Q70_00008511 [Brassica cretica]KAF3547809.1 hypothetical protein DY000_02002027 [Brassica cretica]